MAGNALLQGHNVYYFGIGTNVTVLKFLVLDIHISFYVHFDLETNPSNQLEPCDLM